MPPSRKWNKLLGGSCSAVLNRAFLDSRHVSTEYRIHARLVSRPLLLEPPQNILIDPKRDGLLGRRMNQRGMLEEVDREIGKLGR